jgi:hypothetical protein
VVAFTIHSLFPFLAKETPSPQGRGAEEHRGGGPLTTTIPSNKLLGISIIGLGELHGRIRSDASMTPIVNPANTTGKVFNGSKEEVLNGYIVNNYLAALTKSKGMVCCASLPPPPLKFQSPNAIANLLKLNHISNFLFSFFLCRSVVGNSVLLRGAQCDRKP